MARRRATTKGTARAGARRRALTPEQLAAFRRAVTNGVGGRGDLGSALVARLGGLQYGGARDIYRTAGYVPQGQEKFADYWAAYTRGDIGGRVVDLPAQMAWKAAPDIVEAGAPEGTPFTRAVAALAERLRLWSYCERLDRVAGIGRYGVMFIGVKGAEDQAVQQPAGKVSGPGDIVYLAVYHEENAEIMTWGRDPGAEDYGLPRVYRLRTAEMGVTGAIGLQVHRSRVIHAAEDLLEDNVYGRPRLMRVLNRLFDLDKIAASTGEAYWQQVARILQAVMDKDAEIDSATLDTLDTQLSEMVHDLRRQFFAQGIKLEWLGGDVPDVSQVADFYFSLVAAASGIPKRILFGSELGQLASAQDALTFAAQVRARQAQFCEPAIVRAFIDRMVEWGAVPAPQTGRYQVLWAPVLERSHQELTSANLQVAQTAAALAGVGGDARALVEIDEAGQLYLVEQSAAEATARDDVLGREMADVPEPAEEDVGAEAGA